MCQLLLLIIFRLIFLEVSLLVLLYQIFAKINTDCKVDSDSKLIEVNFRYFLMVINCHLKTM